MAMKTNDPDFKNPNDESIIPSWRCTNFEKSMDPNSKPKNVPFRIMSQSGKEILDF